MFPIFLDLSGKLAVVVGAGPVGRRKALKLVRAGASVRVVCLEEKPASEAFSAMEWLTGSYRAENLQGASLVFAAATVEVNRRVLEDACREGLWINMATSPKLGNFFLPATVERGNLQVAIGTDGASPAIARQVGQIVENQLDEAFGQWVDLLGELRSLILARVQVSSVRREFLNRWSGLEWLERVRREGVPAVREIMKRELNDQFPG